MWSFVAQTSTPANDLISFAQYRILGLVLIAILFGYLWARPSVLQLLAELQAAREHTKALEEIRRLLASVDRRLDEMNRKLDERNRR